MAGAWVAPAADGSAAPQAGPVPRCYATAQDPGRVLCYRVSAKAEYRHGQMVYIPLLIQVPTPSEPPSVVIVNSFDDMRPDTGPGGN
jgi:hypothetical protein